MASLADLHRNIQNTLASKRLGTPVFVRYLLHTREGPAAHRLSYLARLVGNWIGQPLERFGLVSDPSKTAVTLHLEFRLGATGVVTWTSAPGQGLGVDVLVLGNHGSLAHDSGNAMLWDAPAALPAPAPPDPLTKEIEQALQSPQPQTVRELP